MGRLERFVICPRSGGGFRRIFTRIYACLVHPDGWVFLCLSAGCDLGCTDSAVGYSGGALCFLTIIGLVLWESSHVPIVCTDWTGGMHCGVVSVFK